MITVTRIYRPEGVSVAHIDTEGCTQAELWQWWRWGQGSEKYVDGLSLADKLPLHRALRDRTAVLSASKRRGFILLTARLP